MDEQKVLEAVKTLGEYCQSKECDRCIFYSKGTNDSCKFHYSNPILMAKKIKTETREIFIWEGDK